MGPTDGIFALAVCVVLSQLSAYSVVLLMLKRASDGSLGNSRWADDAINVSKIAVVVFVGIAAFLYGIQAAPVLLAWLATRMVVGSYVTQRVDCLQDQLAGTSVIAE